MDYKFDSFLTFLLEEVVKADMAMQDRQLDAWKHFSDNRPRGELVNDDIDKGWAQQRYLALNEVKFKFQVRLEPQNFYLRLKQGLLYIFGKYNPQAFKPVGYQLSGSDGSDSVEVTITVKQEVPGKLKITYEPIDDETRKFFMTSPFLQNI